MINQIPASATHWHCGISFTTLIQFYSWLTRTTSVPNSVKIWCPTKHIGQEGRMKQPWEKLKIKKFKKKKEGYTTVAPVFKQCHVDQYTYDSEAFIPAQKFTEREKVIQMFLKKKKPCFPILQCNKNFYCAECSRKDQKIWVILYRSLRCSTIKSQNLLHR